MEKKGSSGSQKPQSKIFGFLPLRVSSAGFFIATLLLGAVLVTSQANALTGGGPAGLTGEFNTVKDAIDDFVVSQWVAGADGEAGFLVDTPALKSRLDSNNDGVFLGAGDDAAYAPVLVDVVDSSSTMIPATSFRCNWNTTCMSSSSVNSLKSRVDSHSAAGFTTEVLVYGTNGHAESPVAGGYGAIAQAGGLGTGTEPEVRVLKWGRSGWNIGRKIYANAATMVTPGSSGGWPYATNANCTGVTPDSEMVRCAAEWALSPSGGNVSNGTIPPFSSKQAVDVRSGLVDKTVNGGTLPSLHVPIENLFNSDLTDLNPAGSQKLFVGRTQHVPGIAAMGAEMLGYDAVFIQWGIPGYNKNYGELYTSGAGHPVIMTPVDTLPPSQVDVTIGSATATTLDISRTTNEVATMKVEYGQSPGVYSNTINDTVLDTLKTVTLTGLTPGSPVYFRVTSYDGQANASSSYVGSTDISPPPCIKPSLTIGLLPNAAYWDGYDEYQAGVLSVEFVLGNEGTADAFGAAVTGAASTNSVNLVSTMPMAAGDIPGGSSTVVTLRYQIPDGVASFRTSLAGSAMDWCGVSYEYPEGSA